MGQLRLLLGKTTNYIHLLTPIKKKIGCSYKPSFIIFKLWGGGVAFLGQLRLLLNKLHSLINLILKKKPLNK